MATVSRDSSVGTATRLRTRRSGDRISVGGDIFRTRPDRPWGPPCLLCNECRDCPAGKTAGALCRPPTQSIAEVKEIVELYTSTLPLGHSWHVLG
jgi:hypothetical protein